MNGNIIVRSFDELASKPFDELTELRNLMKQKGYVIVPIKSFIDDFEIKVVALMVEFGVKVVVKYEEWNQDRSYNDEADEVIYFMKSMARFKMLLNAPNTEFITDKIIFWDFIGNENNKQGIEISEMKYELPDKLRKLLNTQYNKLFEIEKLISTEKGK
jgi:hypothetical protein